MWTAAKIKRHITRLPDDQIFSTREFLTYGLRAAVDQALHRLVKTKVIIRLARGLFIKNLKSVKYPTLAEIAVAKARAFGKRISMHGLDALHKFGVSEVRASTPMYIALGGHTSFKTGPHEITIKGRAPRFERLGDSPVGLAIRAMRQLPVTERTLETFNQIRQSMRRTDREELRFSAWMMPSWLSDLAYDGHYKLAIAIIP